MGGRSRESQKERVHSDHWMWVTELSNDRLERYGHYSANELDASYREKRPHQRSVDAVNHELVKEHVVRFGFEPAWKAETAAYRAGVETVADPAKREAVRADLVSRGILKRDQD